jgi:hypothetical protein
VTGLSPLRGQWVPSVDLRFVLLSVAFLDGGRCTSKISLTECRNLARSLTRCDGRVKILFSVISLFMVSIGGMLLPQVSHLVSDSSEVEFHATDP